MDMRPPPAAPGLSARSLALLAVPPSLPLSLTPSLTHSRTLPTRLLASLSPPPLQKNEATTWGTDR